MTPFPNIAKLVKGNNWYCAGIILTVGPDPYEGVAFALMVGIIVGPCPYVNTADGDGVVDPPYVNTADGDGVAFNICIIVGPGPYVDTADGAVIWLGDGDNCEETGLYVICGGLPEDIADWAFIETFGSTWPNKLFKLFCK